MNAIVDRIPVVRDIKIDTEVIQRRLSILGDPASLGAIIGALLGIIAGIEVKAILQTAITMAAVMTIIPRMAKMLMEGSIRSANVFRKLLSRGPDRLVKSPLVWTLPSASAIR